MANQQLEVLEQLAELAPTQFLERTPGGQSTLRELYIQAAEADLVPSSAAADDIARLHGLWEVALDHGMGGLVLDYLSQVRGHRQPTAAAVCRRRRPTPLPSPPRFRRSALTACAPPATPWSRS